jgi:hypothetical protein
MTKYTNNLITKYTYFIIITIIVKENKKIGNITKYNKILNLIYKSRLNF